ncbi:hypothetical protein HAX54_049854 [Datura stramonium]|uniref:Uncharacterized protein n=1 Tax=Datura stramonium TaxID=4076 RepID=A0ABS8SVL3_DATST|nr:hypothetical protein [Datura stramonium]
MQDCNQNISLVDYNKGDRGEETAAEYGGRRKCSNLHKKEMESVSKVMAERGHFVSPPSSVRDKFNDLNKGTRDSMRSTWNPCKNDNDEEDHEADLEDRDEYEENNRLHGMSEGFSKRIKQCQGHETVTFGNSLTSLDCNRTLISQPQPDAHQVFPEGNKADILQKQWMDHRLLQQKNRSCRFRHKCWNWRKSVSIGKI